MTTYVAIPNGDIDQNSPITQPLMTAMRDNVLAIAENDTSAPKIKRRFTSGGAAQTVTFGGLILYAGVSVSVYCKTGTGAGTANLTVSASDDGATFYGASNLVTGAASDQLAVGHFIMDFTTGAFEFAGSIGVNPLTITGTITGASTAITHLRFTGSSASVVGSYMLAPNGGLT